MQFVLTAVLLATVVVTSAIHNPRSLSAKDLIKPRGVITLDLTGDAHAHHFIRKRQSQACVDAYLETQTTQFEQCSQLLSDAEDITVNEILAFCDDDHCVSELTRVFTDLQSCGFDNSTVSNEHVYFVEDVVIL